MSLSKNSYSSALRNPSHFHSTGIPRYAIPYRRPNVLECELINTSINMVQFEQEDRQPKTCERKSDYHFNESPQSFGEIKSSANGIYMPEENKGRYFRNTHRAKSVQPPDWFDRYRCKDGSNNRDSGSEHSGTCSSTGRQTMITAKVGSFTNAHHRPGGGNVKILNQKLDFSSTESKCNSKANLKFKPGGGDIEITDEKLNFKEISRPKVNSLKNAKHTPGGGDIKIFNERLPWLTYNKPNLASEERARINKRSNDYF